MHNWSIRLPNNLTILPNKNIIMDMDKIKDKLGGGSLLHPKGKAFMSSGRHKKNWKPPR